MLNERLEPHQTQIWAYFTAYLTPNTFEFLWARARLVIFALSILKQFFFHNQHLTKEKIITSKNDFSVRQYFFLVILQHL